MHPHKKLAEQLNCSRLLIDRSMMMLNIIDAMSYFTLDEKAEIIDLLLQKANQEAMPRPQLIAILERCPLQDFSVLEDIVPPKNLIFGLGDLAVAEWIPEVLEKITGDAPAPPDEDEIARVHQEMWAEVPTQQAEEPEPSDST